ncbi:MAG: hypothetical protein JWP81_3057 [Ferruginibacter sp.]|nr:hypothetical protein [Ferruginibacter sp.]
MQGRIANINDKWLQHCPSAQGSLPTNEAHRQIRGCFGPGIGFQMNILASPSFTAYLLGSSGAH